MRRPRRPMNKAIAEAKTMNGNATPMATPFDTFAGLSPAEEQSYFLRLLLAPLVFLAAAFFFDSFTFAAARGGWLT